MTQCQEILQIGATTSRLTGKKPVITGLVQILRERQQVH